METAWRTDAKRGEMRGKWGRSNPTKLTKTMRRLLSPRARLHSQACLENPIHSDHGIAKWLRKVGSSALGFKYHDFLNN
jgi:hypothetical protein